jgi:putative peptidoglycan lipid II flippase
MSRFARSSLIVSIFFAFDKVLGFARSLIVNRQFGLSYELDVFNAANNIPDLLSALISGGALGVALIPVLSEYLEKKGRKDAWELFSRILNLAFVVTASIAILLAIFAPAFVTKVVAPGFPLEQQQLTIELMRLDLIAIIIFSISGLVMAGLHANQHFLLPALAPGLYNIGQIFGALVLAPEGKFELGPISINGMGLGIMGLVYGVIIGAFLHLLIQVPGLIKYKFKWTPKINIKSPGVSKVMKLLAPRVATMFFIQMFFIVRDNLASGMGEGSVSALNLGWFIMQVPETMIGTAIAIALLPTISELFAQEQTEKFKNTINMAVKAIIALTIPIAAIIAIGLQPLVDIAFGFAVEGTEMVVLAARIYLIGLTGHALLEIVSRSFYAQQNARIPLYAAALNAIGFIIMAIIFSRSFGFAGIAVANVIAFTIEALLLLWLLNKKFPGILEVRKTIIRIAGGTLLAGGVVFIGMQLFNIESYGKLTGAGITAGLMLAGLLVSIPFILPELKAVIKLEN